MFMLKHESPTERLQSAAISYQLNAQHKISLSLQTHAAEIAEGFASEFQQ